MKECVLCGKASETVENFQMTEQARKWLQDHHPEANPDESLSRFGVCQECRELPVSERKRIADIAKERILAEARLEKLAYEVGTKEIAGGVRRFRIDLAKTLDLTEFPEEVWEWLDLMGHILLLTQAHARLHDTYAADTPYIEFLVRAIQCDIGTLSAIYILLRFELVHQAAAHVRLFCESVITLAYIAKDIDRRLPQFLDYAHIEKYEIAKAVLEQERERANQVHVQNLQEFVESVRSDYERVKPRYTRTGRRGRARFYVNWCDRNLRAQAEDCGPAFVRLYRVVYSQLSAYVHGSEWSRRRQIAYRQKYYQRDVVLVDIATVVRSAVVVWEYWGAFVMSSLGGHSRKYSRVSPQSYKSWSRSSFR